jgi:hypothetical protein
MPTRITPVCLTRPSTPVRGAALDADAGDDAGVVDDEGAVLVLVLVPVLLGTLLMIRSRYVQPA